MGKHKYRKYSDVVNLPTVVDLVTLRHGLVVSATMKETSHSITVGPQNNIG